MTDSATIAEPKAGEIRTDIPIDAYHGGPGISASQIADWLDTCPLYWKQDRDLPRQAPSPEMVFGDLVHCLTIEPERFAERFFVEPDEIDGEPVNKRKPAHRDALAAWREGLPAGACEVAPQDLVDAGRCARALQRSTFFRDLLGEAPLIEASYYAEDPVTGLLLKARPDIYSGLVSDIKTTRDSGLHGFSRQVANLHYDTKAAFYEWVIELCTGEAPSGFVWVAINRDRCVPEFYPLDDARRAIGRSQFRRALDELAHCLETDTWPSFSGEGLRPMPLESWRRRELEEATGVAS